VAGLQHAQRCKSESAQIGRLFVVPAKRESYQDGFKSTLVLSWDKRGDGAWIKVCVHDAQADSAKI